MNEFEKQSFEAKLKRYRLSQIEYDRICDLLKRKPNDTEWALFSALWSEHCSYKSSKIHLRKFSYRNKRTPLSDGENAGLVDLGHGEKIIFKMESHNHPSFIEPYQGAATGVGGILRDIFTMGARPIALANYLCFGDLSAPRMKDIVKGVVSGIAGYGNCVGVPMLTGATHFSEKYNQNVLVNAMAVGLITDDMQLALSRAQGPGNLVVYVGAKTGRDGVHGASMASESFGQSGGSDKKEMAAKKVNVQIGDPFLEKLLIESCLEVLDKKLVVAMQDMGAAGLISSSFEMASKGQVGMEMVLDQVPLRDQNMVPEEILLSESQERMLLVIEPKNLKALQDVFHRWGLDAVSIGRIIPERKMKIQWRGEWLTEIDPDLLTENAPRYERKFSSGALNFDFKKEVLKSGTKTTNSNLKKNFQGHPDLLPKSFIYDQYDQRVGAATASDCSESVGVFVLPKTKRALFVALGCRPHLMKISSRFGAMDALLQPYLQMALKGGEGLAVTDCLNFGNPEKLDIMTEFVTSVEAIAAGAEILDMPVISGNVSFYNETKSENIISTPAVGLVGLGPDVNLHRLPSDYFNQAGLRVFHIDMSEMSFDDVGFAGELNFPRWKKAAVFLRKMAPKLASAHLVGRLGLLNSLMRMTEKGVGFVGNQKAAELVQKFGSKSYLYQAVVAVRGELPIEFESLAETFGAQIFEIGQTEDEKFHVHDVKLNGLSQYHQSRRKELGGLLEVLA